MAEEIIDNQTTNRKPWLWQKGQSGNPKGRPPGRSLKEWTRARLAEMTDEERIAFLNALSPDIAWRMAEGNPAQDSKIEHSGEIKTGTPLPKEALEIIEADLKKKKTGDGV